MSDTVLSTTLHAVATALGDRLPAAYGLDPSDVMVSGEIHLHEMPANAHAVRWVLGDEAAVLVVAVSPDAAAMLTSGPPEVSLVAALTPRVAPLLPLLVDVLGDAPELGVGEEVSPDEALMVGPGDAVSVRLDDVGVHRATVALRMVVSDALVQRTPAEDGWDDMDHDDQAGGAQPIVAGQPADLNGTPVAAEHDPGMSSGQAPMGPAGQAIPAGQAMPAGRRKAYHDPLANPQAEARPAEFAAFDQLHSFPGAAHSMAMLGEVEMGVTAELGRTKLTVRDILALNQGSIIELDRAAGSPVDVVVNGTLIARGEVVVIDEEFGIRITEIVGMDDGVAGLNLPMAQ